MFFSDIDGITILERNVAKVEGLEAREIRRLIKMYRQALMKVKVDLLLAQDNTFTEAKLTVTMRKLERALKDLEQLLNPELKLAFENMSEEGAEDSAKEINRFEKFFNGISSPVNIEAIIASTKPENFLFNQFQSSMATYNESLRGEFQRVLGQALLQNKTWSQAVSDIGQAYAGSEWRIARIVRTEMHQIYNVSKLSGFENIQSEYFQDLKKTLYHPIDSRTSEDSKTAAAKNLIVDLDDPFVYTFKQGDKVVTRKFQTPPDRPNDRSILIPYRESYDKNK